MKITIEQIEELLTVFEKNAKTVNKCVIFNPLIKKRLEEIGCTFKYDKIIFQEKELYFAENPYMEPHVMYVLDYTKLNEVRNSIVDLKLSSKKMQTAFLQAGAAISRMGDCFVTFSPESYQPENKPNWWEKVKKFFKQIKIKIHERFRTFKIKRRD